MLIHKLPGDLTPRHMQIFKANEFFAGVSLPTPTTLEPLEAKLPKQQNPHVLDFLKVFLILLTKIPNKNLFQKCVDKDPAKRWTCQQLLNHPYFDSYRASLPVSDIPESARHARDKSRVRKNPNSSTSKKILSDVPIQ